MARGLQGPPLGRIPRQRVRVRTLPAPLTRRPHGPPLVTAACLQAPYPRLASGQ
jgi:hypothetical protein